MSRFLPDGDPHVRRFLVGALLNAIGGGLTLPVLVIYLTRISGMSVSSASIVLSWMAVCGLVFSPVVGSIVDRIGPRPVLLVAILVEALGVALWSQVDSAVSAYAVGTMVALGNAGIWPPQHTMMARMVPPESRQKFFGLQFMMLNLGLGIGGMVSSTIVRTDSPATFTRLFLLDAVSYVVYFCFVLSLRGTGGRLSDEERGTRHEGSYREVFRDRRLVKLSLVSVLMLTCGYASMDGGIPIMLTTYGGLTVNQLGPLWTANTGVIVLLQLVVLKRLEGRSRSRLLGVVAATWALAWVIEIVAISEPNWTFLLAAVSTAVFAVGETVWSPVGSTLQNEIAPEHLRGRYNAVGALAWVVSGSIGPLFSGLMLEHGLAREWLLCLIVGLAVAGSLGVRLRRELTPAEDGTVLRIPAHSP